MVAYFFFLIVFVSLFDGLEEFLVHVSNLGVPFMDELLSLLVMLDFKFFNLDVWDYYGCFHFGIDR